VSPRILLTSDQRSGVAVAVTVVEETVALEVADVLEVPDVEETVVPVPVVVCGVEVVFRPLQTYRG
jgi:hypothetical protein